MERMDMQSRDQYLKVLRERYFKAKAKKEKTEILDEYCRNTDQARKYVIRKMQSVVDLRPKPRKRRKQIYDGQVTATLAEVWEIFDRPCGQRLKPVLEIELDRLVELGEVRVSDEVALKLKRMSSATIDRKLKHQREVLHLFKSKGGSKPGALLKSKIAIRLTEWDTSKVGYVEMDLVSHCGSSSLGQYINTLSTTEISSGWWEGEAIMGKFQQSTFQALKRIRERTPIDWKGVDSDNGPEFINDILYKYCCRERLEFTRSRPYKKNDNAYIEQKNWTHVRKTFGYLRHDTVAEIMIMNDLYRGDLRLYKNFFQPVMKLVSKERIGGKLKKKI
ncbi:transposase [Dehalococcoidia bacterium]|nr:transposase [Dehalococcoidia bacterium]